MAHYVVCPQKKNNIPHFQNQRCINSYNRFTTFPRQKMGDCDVSSIMGIIIKEKRILEQNHLKKIIRKSTL
jgi:hypothetical protein